MNATLPPRTVLERILENAFRVSSGDVRSRGGDPITGLGLESEASTSTICLGKAYAALQSIPLDAPVLDGFIDADDPYLCLALSKINEVQRQRGVASDRDRKDIFGFEQY